MIDFQSRNAYRFNIQINEQKQCVDGNTISLMDRIDTDRSGPVEPAELNDELVSLLPKLRAEALYLTRSSDKADDLLQATCLRALSRSHQYSANTRLDRWVSTIMNHIWFDELRKVAVRQEQELLEPNEVAETGFERRVEAQILISDLRRACSKLSDDDFSLLVKIHVYGWTYRQVADDLGVPIGTVLSRVSRAKSLIKDVG